MNFNKFSYKGTIWKDRLTQYSSYWETFVNSDNIRKFGFGQNYSPDKIFRRSKFSLDKIFVISEKFRHFCSDIVLSDKVHKSYFFTVLMNARDWLRSFNFYIQSKTARKRLLLSCRLADWKKVIISYTLLRYFLCYYFLYYTLCQIKSFF